MPSMNHLKAVSVGELVAPMLPYSHFLPEESANLKMKIIILYYVNNKTVMNRGKTKAAFITFYNALPSIERGNDWQPLQLT